MNREGTIFILAGAMLKVMCIRNDHQFPLLRRDGNRHSGGKITFIRKEITAKRLTKFETFEKCT